MDITIQPRRLSGTVRAIPSKSQAHRLLICSAFADGPTVLECPSTNRDIEATAECLCALGAGISYDGSCYKVEPITSVPSSAVLNCCESGSTLRFLLPIAGALGVDATFELSGRLPLRPLSPLWEEMERMGCKLSRPTETTVRCQKKLHPGLYRIQGNISSQFVTGLLFALSLLDGESQLELTGKVESLPYIQMTLSALRQFGVSFSHGGYGFKITPAVFRSPGNIYVEGDWSNGAFWLTAQALGSPLTVLGLDMESVQGDRTILRCLSDLDTFQQIDASNIPDLVPILAVAAGAGHGAHFFNAGRLRMKESDRLQTAAELIQNLGGKAIITANTLTVEGTGYLGGTVDAAGDHRIAMSAAIAATVCTQPVTICGAEAVLKSYPAFWTDYKRLGGIL